MKDLHEISTYNMKDLHHESGIWLHLSGVRTFLLLSTSPSLRESASYPFTCRIKTTVRGVSRAVRYQIVKHTTGMQDSVGAGGCIQQCGTFSKNVRIKYHLPGSIYSCIHSAVRYTFSSKVTFSTIPGYPPLYQYLVVHANRSANAPKKINKKNKKKKHATVVEKNTFVNKTINTWYIYCDNTMAPLTVLLIGKNDQFTFRMNPVCDY